MFDELQQSLRVYMRSPALFVHNSITYVFFQLLVILALAGFLLVAFFTASVLRQSPTSIPMLFLYSIALVVFFYFSAAFQGALIYGYSKSLDGQAFRFLDFYRYALNNGFRFFWIFILKLAVEFIFVAPLGLLYIYVLRILVLPYLEVFLLLLVLGLMFVAGFLFFGAFVAAALYDMTARPAVSANLRFIRQRHILAIISFGILAGIWAGNFIPLVQIGTLLVAYPVVLSAYMLYLKNALEKKEAVFPKAPPPPQQPAAKTKKG